MTMTASQFVDARGGPKAVADATGKQPNAVSVWKNRNKIPRDAWPDIQLAWPDVSLADLLAIEKASAEAEAGAEPSEALA